MKKRKKVVVAKPAVLISDEFATSRIKTRKFLAKLDEAEKMMVRHRLLFECIKELRDGFKFYVINSCESLLVIAGIKVKKMTDIQPVLELLEKNLKITFTGSSDQGELKWRTFTNKEMPWFRVDAEIADDSESCKQVIVGYEQTPKYELRCEETA